MASVSLLCLFAQTEEVHTETYAKRCQGMQAMQHTDVDGGLPGDDLRGQRCQGSDVQFGQILFQIDQKSSLAAVGGPIG